MYKSFMLFLFLPFYLHAYSVIDYSFITKYEYGEMLYENPRGIGCNKCHGEKGEGKLIATYKDSKGHEKQLYGPKISNVTWEQFKETLSKKENKSLVMPTYFLTNEELVSIHYYITNLKK